MQTNVAETIFDIVKVLPETKQRKVLDFVTDLQETEGGGLIDLLKFIEEESRSIPDEAFEEIASDGSANHDHYLYGSKKRY